MSVEMLHLHHQEGILYMYNIVIWVKGRKSSILVNIVLIMRLYHMMSQDIKCPREDCEPKMGVKLCTFKYIHNLAYINIPYPSRKAP